jgi:Holliday junction resolvasome RuvABC endonuclease subunit
MLSKALLGVAPKPKGIITVDASTNSLAFALFHDKTLVKIGKVNFTGKDAYYKAADAALKASIFFNDYDIDAMVIESVPFMNSPKTALQLALVQGAIVGAMACSGVEVMMPVTAMQWQNHIGNKALTAAEKSAMLKQYPGKTKSWYKTKTREIRKQRTIDYVNKRFNLNLDDNDVTDAIGIGCYVVDRFDILFGDA